MDKELGIKGSQLSRRRILSLALTAPIALLANCSPPDKTDNKDGSFPNSPSPNPEGLPTPDEAVTAAIAFVQNNIRGKYQGRLAQNRLSVETINELKNSVKQQRPDYLQLGVQKFIDDFQEFDVYFLYDPVRCTLATGISLAGYFSNTNGPVERAQDLFKIPQNIPGFVPHELVVSYIRDTGFENYSLSVIASKTATVAGLYREKRVSSCPFDTVPDI